jgi:hypothetical protein
MAKRRNEPKEPRTEEEAFNQYNAATGEEHEYQRQLDEWKAKNPRGGATGLEILVGDAKRKREKAAEALARFKESLPKRLR